MSTALEAVRDVLSAVALLAGAVFCLFGALGLVRFPDTLSRLQAAAKAQTLGLLLVLLGAAVQAPLRYALVLALVGLFQLATVPVTGQIVGRTAYRTHALDAGSMVADELRARLERDGEATPETRTDPDADR